MKKIYALFVGLVLATTSYAQCSITIGSVVNPLCNGQCTGAATATPSGFVTTPSYTWTPTGGNAATATGLCAGTYTVTASNGLCTATQTVNIVQPTMLMAAESHTNVACFGGSNGSATAIATGG